MRAVTPLTTAKCREFERHFAVFVSEEKKPYYSRLSILYLFFVVEIVCNDLTVIAVSRCLSVLYHQMHPFILQLVVYKDGMQQNE